MTIKDFDEKSLSGRNRRLLNEWKMMDSRLSARKDIRWSVETFNEMSIPTVYRIQYLIHSMCGLKDMDLFARDRKAYNPPEFADSFQLLLSIPEGYPCIDSPAEYRFMSVNEAGLGIAMPWHPNIRFFGSFAGHVCLNMIDTYTDIVWGVERIASYLRYELYHAEQTAPFPEDLKVAEWILQQAEPYGWVRFDQPVI